MKLADLAILGVLVTPLSAVELADLAGDWNLGELESPTSLREIYYNTVTETSRTSADSQDYAKTNEILTFAYYPDPLYTETRSFGISPSGAVTGDEVGQVLGISSNRLTYTDIDGAVTLYSNTIGDILLVSQRKDDRQGQTLCLKKPAFLTTAELAGNWRLASMINPTDISINVFDGRLADTYFIAESELLGGDITITAGGTFSGLFSGTVSGSGPGNMTVTTGGGSIPFKLNASKNVAVATLGDSDEAEIILLVRKPTTLTTAELAGTWRISAMQIPTSLTENFYNVVTTGSRQADSDGTAFANEILVDIFHKDEFELNRLQVFVDAAGNMSGSETGTLTANGTGVSLFSDGEVTPLHVNADKTCMVGINSFSDSHELILCVKTSDEVVETFEEAVDLKVGSSAGMVVLNWNSASNICLEESGSLTGFVPVEEAEGGDSYIVDPSGGGAKFYRVAEKVEP